LGRRTLHDLGELGSGWPLDLWRDHRVFVPYVPIQNGVEASGKKAGEWGDTQRRSGFFPMVASPSGEADPCRLVRQVKEFAR
jgi:hypothetical protein